MTIRPDPNNSMCNRDDSAVQARPEGNSQIRLIPNALDGLLDQKLGSPKARPAGARPMSLKQIRDLADHEMQGKHGSSARRYVGELMDDTVFSYKDEPPRGVAKAVACSLEEMAECAMRSAAQIKGCSPAALATQLQERIADAATEPKRGSSIVHVQQGGSSTETYVHIHATKGEASQCRRSCENAAYQVSEDMKTDVPMKPNVIQLMDFISSETARLR